MKHDAIATLVRNITNDVKLSSKFDIEGLLSSPLSPPLLLFFPLLFRFDLFFFLVIDCINSTQRDRWPGLCGAPL